MPLIAFGMAGHLTSLTSFINEQFSGEELDGSSFWRFFYSVLAIVIVTSVVVGSCSYKYFRPPGSSFTLFFQVFVAAFLEISHKSPRDAKELFEFTNPEFCKAPHTRSLRCLDKAATIIPTIPLEEQANKIWRLCRAKRRAGRESAHDHVLASAASFPARLFQWSFQLQCFFVDQLTVLTQRYLPFFVTGVFWVGIERRFVGVRGGEVSEMGRKRNWFGHDVKGSRVDKYYWTLAWLMGTDLVLFVLVSVFISIMKPS
ncbi:Protein NRT1/ PTR FAMILY 5.5 [Striga hermonthica]|uniref:Protein NRT1/ PTR FAMILY 5.5 n=1 Tax=Striga hermonthica TaxID=68872 RepID=A0A9N7NRH4_STRHE|nr:Protein NRT1/ PTR FAMILY 5.5 [Striga hermonthica]